MDRFDVPKITTDRATADMIWRKLKGINPEIDPRHKLVVLNPNASQRFPMRRMPIELFTELARRLLEDPDVYILITGVASERPDAQYICTRVASRRTLDLTGATTLKELLHVFDLAQVLVSNDSGPAHFACLTRVHVIVLFGPEIPERYRPLATSVDVVHTGYTCSPCIGPFNQRLSPCNDNLCMKSIDVEKVSALVRARLQPVLLPHQDVRRG
jgi:ADP-heptose:LPS heptosyltransferase